MFNSCQCNCLNVVVTFDIESSYGSHSSPHCSSCPVDGRGPGESCFWNGQNGSTFLMQQQVEIYIRHLKVLCCKTLCNYLCQRLRLLHRYMHIRFPTDAGETLPCISMKNYPILICPTRCRHATIWNLSLELLMFTSRHCFLARMFECWIGTCTDKPFWPEKLLAHSTLSSQ